MFILIDFVYYYLLLFLLFYYSQHFRKLKKNRLLSLYNFVKWNLLGIIFIIILFFILVVNFIVFSSLFFL